MKELPGTPLDAVLCREVVDALELSIVVVDTASREVRLANERAAGSLGLAVGPLPGALSQALLRWLGASEPRPPFELVSNDGRRYLARAKPLAPSSLLLLTFSPDRPGARELDEELRARHALSRRELQVVLAIRAGASNSEIAARMRLREGTVKNYLTRIFAALGVHSRTHLLAYLQSLAAHA